MDDTLCQAIIHLLGQIEEVVEDLLLIEVDWGEHTPLVTDEPANLSFQGAQWPLVFTDSELILRRVLCRAGAGGKAILAFRSGDGFQVPLDIRARAHKSTVHRLGLRHRLYALTGKDWPPEVDYAEWRPSIERHLDTLVRYARSAAPMLSVTRGDLEEILVQAAFGITVRGRGAAQLLADLVSVQRRSPDPPTALERSLLQGQLRLHQVDQSQVLVWAAEEVGRAAELVRTGVMMGAERAARLGPSWGSLYALRALLVNERQMAENDAFDVAIDMSTRALRHLHPSTRQAVVKEAETTLGDVIPDDSYNPWFPSALERETERLARRLARRDASALPETSRLREHLFATQYRLRLTVLDEMRNLVTQWEDQSGQVASLTDITGWASWYAYRGSRVDLAALKLTYHQYQGTGLDEHIQRLLKGYWAWRDWLNADFARSLVGSYEAALHDRDGGVFGAHRILDWTVRPLLQDDRRVLLLIIDGMGFAAFWHLVDQWAEHTPPVYVCSPFDERSPDLARGLSISSLPTSLPKAALSLLPSVTSVSRKAIFLNALPTDPLDDEETYREKVRTGEARALQQALKGRTTRLYNKSNLGSGRQLLDDLSFSDLQAIVVIHNAIDDDLGSTTTTVRLPRLEDLVPLGNAVRTALDGGWEVVVTADHGHTWHRDKDLRRGRIVSGGGERFMPVVSGVDLPSDAIVTQDPHIVRLQKDPIPSNARVALLTATGTYFGQQPRRGHHGGASLEEVVVPCALLTRTAPATRAEAETSTSAAEGAEPVQIEKGKLTGIVLTLYGSGQVRNLELLFAPSPREVKLLQTLARLGEASEADLKRALGTRRVSGPLTVLRERLASAGQDYIEELGSGPGGTRYRFRVEML